MSFGFEWDPDKADAEQGRLLVVVHADGDDEVIRLISARPPTGREWMTYAESRRR